MSEGIENKAERYSLTVRILHWVSAVIILWATVTGLYSAFFEMDEKLLEKILHFNVSITFVFIPVFMYRTLYRIILFKERETPERVNYASFIMQIMLYVVVNLVLITGVLMMDHSYDVFHLIDIKPLVHDKTWLHIYEVTHIYLSRLLAALIVLHVMAVIMHCMRKNNCVLRRMI